MTTAVQLAQSVAPGVSLGFKNRIINGAMTIDQRNAGASVTATDGTYSLDRWKSFLGAPSKFSIQQNAGSVTPPAGFKNYLGITSLAATTVASGDYYGFSQAIEGLNCADLDWGTANAKAVTLSFWVRSSLTGQFGGSILNSANNYSYPFSFTISAANTWEYKTITVAGPTSGTWLTTNGTGIMIVFNLGYGSTYCGTAGAWASGSYYSSTGSTNIVSTNGATFYITGVQLEVGTAATSFEFRDYGRELILCQRYLWVPVPAGTSLASLGGVAQGGYGASNNTALIYINFPIQMRAAPSFESASIQYNNSSISGTPSNIALGGATNSGVSLQFDGTNLTSSSVVNLRTTNTSGYMRFVSEL